MSRLNVITIACLLLQVLCGCARYQFSIVEPADAAQSIERRGEIYVQEGPIEYTFVDLGRSLGVRIANISDDPIVLLGEHSYVVAPDAATHNMRGGTIASRSYTALALPPEYRVYRAGPRFGVGMGIGGGRGGRYFGTGVGTTWGGYHPGYYETFSTVTPWSWTTGDVRMRTVFDHAGERLQHDFTFRRERIN